MHTGQGPDARRRHDLRRLFIYSLIRGFLFLLVVFVYADEICSEKRKKSLIDEYDEINMYASIENIFVPLSFAKIRVDRTTKKQQMRRTIMRRVHVFCDDLLRFAIRYMTSNATEKVNQLSERMHATGSTRTLFHLYPHVQWNPLSSIKSCRQFVQSEVFNIFASGLFPSPRART